MAELTEKPARSLLVHDNKYGETVEIPIDGSINSNQSSLQPSRDLEQAPEEEPTRPSPLHKMGRRLRPSKAVVCLVSWLLVTAWWIAGLVLHRHDLNWVQPFLLWLAISIRIATLFVPARYALIPLRFIWGHSVVQFEKLIPRQFRALGGATIVFAAVMIAAFVPPEHDYNRRSDRAVSLFGYVVFLVGLWATSRHRSAINWRPVIVGILIQFIMAIFVLRTTLGKDIFTFLSGAFTTGLEYAKYGVIFLTDEDSYNAHSSWFLLGSLPIFIFFTAIIQMFYYVGFIQWLVPKASYIFWWALNITGVEASVATMTPFLGFGEAAIFIKGFIPHMTQAEIHQIMTCGFSTISGALMVVYVGLGASGQAVISSCLMSIPISVVISKLRVPETEEPLTTGHLKVINIEPDDGTSETNVLHAMANGAWIGLKVAGMVLANLIVIISLVALANGILDWCFKYIQLPHLTISEIFGYIFYPVAFLMGVPRNELYLVGQLLGMKTIQNEFVAFAALTSEPKFAHLSQRANIIATYAICGFANLGSIAILLGIYGQFSPQRRGDFARNAFSSFVCGALATFMSASLAGMLFSE